MTAAVTTKCPVDLAINRTDGGALQIFAESLQRELDWPTDVVDFRETAPLDDAVRHYAVWYLYRQAERRPPADRCLVTVHHLVRWHRAMDELVRKRIPVTTMSSEWFHYLRRRMPPGRVVLVPFGIDLEAWTPRAPVSPEGRLNVGLVGRAYPDGRKGQRLVPRIFAALPRSRFRVTIVGAEWDEIVDDLRAQSVDVEHHASLPFDDLRNVCRGFDLFLCTSDVEGGPLPLLEAMAMGITPVSTPVGHARDLLAGSGLGYLFPKGNPWAAASILRRLASGRLPMACPDRLRAAAARLSWENAARGYETVYRAIDESAPLPADPTGYLPWLERLQRRKTWRDRIALAANPEPVALFHQPLAWRAWNRVGRLALATCRRPRHRSREQPSSASRGR